MSGRILVIDDEPEIRRALRTGLGYHGYEVSTANSGEEGLARLLPIELAVGGNGVRGDAFDLVAEDGDEQVAALGGAGTSGEGGDGHPRLCGGACAKEEQGRRQRAGGAIWRGTGHRGR